MAGTTLPICGYFARVAASSPTKKSRGSTTSDAPNLDAATTAAPEGMPPWVMVGPSSTLQCWQAGAQHRQASTAVSRQPSAGRRTNSINSRQSGIEDCIIRTLSHPRTPSFPRATPRTHTIQNRAKNGSRKAHHSTLLPATSSGLSTATSLAVTNRRAPGLRRKADDTTASVPV